MFSSIQLSLCSVLAITSLVNAHSVITYPGWRGNNLHTVGFPNQTEGLGEYMLPNGTTAFPFGMQWMYPCGGSPLTTNRTNWPIKGGAVAFQPGWFSGHSSARLFINMGEGTNPKNMSLPILPEVGINGPNNEQYPDLSVCFPQLPLPAHYDAKIGDNATIQVIMLAQHGAALYSCVDITFTEPEDVAEVNEENCHNSSEISFVNVFTTSSLTSAATSIRMSVSLFTTIPMLAALTFAFL